MQQDWVYGLLYTLSNHNGLGYCQTDPALGDRPGLPFVELPSTNPPNQDPSITAVFGVATTGPGGTCPCFLTIKPAGSDPNDATIPACIAFFHAGAWNPYKAVDIVNRYFPMFTKSGTTSEIDCGWNPPPPPPPPSPPAPPMFPPLRCGPMGSKYIEWKATDTGAGAGWNGGTLPFRHKYPGQNYFNEYGVRDAITGLFVNDPAYPKQHPDMRTKVSREEWADIARSDRMNDQFPGQDFSCDAECRHNWDDRIDFTGYGTILTQEYPASRDPNRYFRVRTPDRPSINQARLYYDTVDLCRACRLQCCKTACCDGDDDDSWTWGCDVFRQKTNQAHPVETPGQRSDGLTDPFLYGLETGGIEISYDQRMYSGVEYEHYYADLGNNPDDYRPTEGTPWDAGWMYNDAAWDDECSQPELACDNGESSTARRELSSASFEVSVVFAGSIETFNASQVQYAFATALAVPLSDVDMTTTPASVRATLRVQAAPDAIDAVHARVLALTANVSTATRALGAQVEQIESVTPPAATVTDLVVQVVGTPAQISVPVFRSIAGIALRLSVEAVEVVKITPYAPGISTIQARVRSDRPRMPLLVDRRFGSVQSANATMSPFFMYAAHMLPPSAPPQPPSVPVADA